MIIIIIKNDFKMNVQSIVLLMAVMAVGSMGAASQAFAKLLKGYIDQGKLGEKTGEGFYTYPNPSYRDPKFLI